jgi:hypothetical protein
LKKNYAIYHNFSCNFHVSFSMVTISICSILIKRFDWIQINFNWAKTLPEFIIFHIFSTKNVTNIQNFHHLFHQYLRVITIFIISLNYDEFLLLSLPIFYISPFVACFSHACPKKKSREEEKIERASLHVVSIQQCSKNIKYINISHHHHHNTLCYNNNF